MTRWGISVNEQAGTKSGGRLFLRSFEVAIVAYKSALATADLVKTALKLSNPIAEKLSAGSAQEVAPERLDEVAETLQEFAVDTYEELKRRLKKGSQPLSPAARPSSATTTSALPALRRNDFRPKDLPNYLSKTVHLQANCFLLLHLAAAPA